MIVLVHELDGSKRRVGGMLLDKEQTWGLAAREFKFWRYSSGWSPVTCRLRPIESMGSGRDAQGRPITFVNDEVVRTDPCLIGPELDFDVDEAVDQSPPFLLLPDNSGAPGCRSARVQLHFSQFSELPDVEAKYQFLRKSSLALIGDRFSDMPEVEEMFRSTPPALQERWAAEQARAPESGLWLPFEIGALQGAMQLGERQGDGIFDAALYVDRDAETIQPGSLLRRSVTWTAHDGESGTADADIASVVEVSSAAT